MATDSMTTPRAPVVDEKSPAGWFRGEGVCILVLFAAVLVCWLPRLRGPIDFRWDGGVYYVSGTSLAAGQGYRLLNEPGDIEATQYPPLLPAIIAAHQLALGTNDHVIVGRWLRIFFFILFNVYIFTAYLIARSYLPLKYALLATLVCLLGLFTYFLSDLCFPEIPFALSTTLFFLCNRKSGRRAYGVLAAVFAIAAYALRTTGTALLAAWVGESLIKRDFKRAALRAAVSAAAVFGWMFYISTVESGAQYNNPAYEYQRANYLFYNVSYAKNIFLFKDPLKPELGPASLGDIAVRFLSNLTKMPSALGETVSAGERLWEVEWAKLNELSPFPVNAPWVVDIALIVLGCLAIGGGGLLLASRQWVIPLYILLSIAVICLTPWPQQFIRYLAPLAPFLTLSLFTLLVRFKCLSGKVLPSRWRPAGAALTWALVVVIFMQQAIILYFALGKWHPRVAYSGQNGKTITYHLFFYLDAYRAFDAGIDWLKPRANPGDVVASSMPHWVYLRTGLKSVMPPFESNPHEAQRLLDSVPVSYLIVDEGLALDTRKYTSPVTHTFPDRWRRVYSDSITTDTGEVIKDRFQIYQRIH
jgi:hypothetical protein